MSPIEAPEMPIPFGVSADTGYPLEGIDDASLTSFQADGHDRAVPREYLKTKSEDDEPNFGTIGDVEPGELDQAGWAVIFSPGADQKIREALQPLLDHRKAQVGDQSLFKIFEGESGYQPDDTADTWLRRQNVRMDVVDPQLGVPYYILLVAPPDEIPFEFQYGLDLYWAVGRLWFETAGEFRQYADSVVRYETMAAVPTARQMAVFSTRHDFDAATQLFSSVVAEPVVSGAVGQRQKFGLRPFIGDPATKSALDAILRGAIEGGPPAVLFTGSHGKSFRPDDPRQPGSQGALICQDWSGYGKVEREAYFDASDLPANAKVHGMVHFLFACYGGGCPQLDSFNRLSDSPKTIASKPMMARLPQALLAHPQGGALAVLAHVDRAWAYSFRAGDKGQTQGFRDVVGRMMRGERMGQATDQFNMRWAALSAGLSDVLDKIRRRKEREPSWLMSEPESKKLANQWVARDDARNYVLFGDPAARLRVEDMPALA